MEDERYKRLINMSQRDDEGPMWIIVLMIIASAIGMLLSQCQGE